MTRGELDAAAVQVWPFAIGIGILIVGMALAFLRKRLKDMREAAIHEG